MKKNIDYIIFLLLCAFNITSIFIELPFNKIIFSFLIVALITACLFPTAKKIDFFTIVITGGLVIYNLYITGEKLINLNDLFYLPLWLMLFIYLNKRHETLSVTIVNNIKIVKYTVIIWVILSLSLCVIDTNFINNGLHRLASNAFMIVSLIWVIYAYTKDKKWLFLIALPVYIVVTSEARTYLGILGVLLLIIFYKQFRNKYLFYLTLVPTILIGVVLIMTSDVGSRFAYEAKGVFDPLAAFTSGRSIFWQADISEFMKLNLTQKLFGNGYNLIYNVNEKFFYGAKIYAHNDFLNIIYANGICGLLIYISIICKYFISMRRKYVNEKKISFAIIFMCFFNAMFNGLYNYPAAVFAIPFIYEGFMILKRTDTN